MTLINLHDFIERTIAEFDADFFSQDRVLPKTFKEYVRNAQGGDKYTFLRYTTVIKTDLSLSIYCPNQWFYIAAYYCKLYPVLKQYKDLVYEHSNLPESSADYKSFFGSMAGNPDKAKQAFANSSLPEDQIELLTIFLSDYSWWKGGKGIERGDFFYSPILSSAALVNQSQSYVAEICKYLVENPDALKILQADIDNHRPISPERELYESHQIVEFMERCVKTFLEYDSNMSQVKFKENNVTVSIPGCNLGKLKSDFDKTTDSRRLNDCNKDIIWSVSDKPYYFYKEQNSASLNSFKDFFNRIYGKKYRIEIDGAVYKLYELSTESDKVSKKKPSCNQVLYYGAPGTGKSHKIEETYLNGRAHFRITFHPDTDYAGFVGCYKPTMGGEAGDRITYDFVPQVFLKAYVEAWKLNRSGEPVYLVIEELNRGNCAQIFGDVFQLLDRQLEGHPGYSKYTVNADSDIARYLKKELADVKEEYEEDIRAIYNPKEFDFSIMALPDNLYILATMNTSDQSLFPIDSAFKRRWEMEYVPVNYKDAEQFTVHINDTHEYNWGYLLEGLNSYIKRVNHSTNKIIGNRFVQAKVEGVIDARTFRDKVLFFLFNDVFKDNDDFKSDFFGEDSENMYFEDLCEKDSDKYIIGFIENETKCNVRNLKASETKDATVSVPVEE